MNSDPTAHFQPGHLTKDGFLGCDIRSIEEIIQQDSDFLAQSGISDTLIADRLQWFLNVGNKALESTAQEDDFYIHVQYDRGMLPCPFGDQGLHPKAVANVRSRKSKKKIQYSQLSVHMIRQHGFYGGKGSSFRLEPEELITYFLSGGKK